MAKRKFHTKVIHPNRYLIWALVVMVIVAGLLVSYASLTQFDIDSNIVNPNTDFWHTYKNGALSFRYPAQWLIDPGSGYVGFGPKDQDEFLVYTYSPPNDAAYQSYLTRTDAKQIMVDQLPGIRVTDLSGRGEQIAFVKTAKYLYEFRGHTLFDKILNTVRISK
jgi:hypothetical protein